MNEFLIKLLKNGVADGVFPGAVAAVATAVCSDPKRFVSCAGIQDIRYPDEKICVDTFFDLASLTKPLATTLIIYSLLAEKKLNIEDKLSFFFKDIASDESTLLGHNNHTQPAMKVGNDEMISSKMQDLSDIQKITIKELLSHSSGILSYFPYFKEYPPRYDKNITQMICSSILQEKLAYPTGTRCVYSDFGFILLGRIAEQITGISLDALFDKYIAVPKRINKGIFYIPLGQKKIKSEGFAATEKCPWRQKIMRAEVHDEHCWLMGGVSGHAGLFGNGLSVLKLCEELLRQYRGGEQQFSWSGLIKTGLQRQYTHSTWCLGFDTPSALGSSGGKYLSTKSVGHLGYAGTSFWIDPEKDLVLVLLTNRVHPSRENTKIKKFRPYFHNSVIEHLGLT